MVANIQFKHIYWIFIGYCIEFPTDYLQLHLNLIKDAELLFWSLFTDSIRLVNGKDTCSGRLQVRAESEWHSVCSEDFTRQSAEMVCRQLGCGVLSTMTGFILEQLETSQWRLKFDCEGNEENCRISAVPGKPCSPGKAIWLSCSGTYLIQTISLPPCLFQSFMHLICPWFTLFRSW